MAYTTANGRLCRNALSSGPIALGLATIALASGTAAWRTHVDPAVSAPVFAPSKYASSFFDNRFFVGNEPQSFATAPPPAPFFRSLPQSWRASYSKPEACLHRDCCLKVRKKHFRGSRRRYRPQPLFPFPGPGQLKQTSSCKVVDRLKPTTGRCCKNSPISFPHG
jgi:hypothetical protein